MMHLEAYFICEDYTLSSTHLRDTY